jgi:hypothetical protein
MANPQGLERALGHIFPIVNEQQAQNLIAQGGVRGNAGAFGNYNYNLITMPRIAGPWRGEVFRVERKAQPGRRPTSNYPLNNVWSRMARAQPPPAPPLQRRAGVRGGSPQRATMTNNSNNNGNVTSRRRQAPLERTNSSRPPPPGGNNAAGAARVSPVEERRIQRNVANQIAQMTPLQSQRWWSANEVRPVPVYPSIGSRGPTANQIVAQYEQEVWLARRAAEQEAKRLRAEARRQMASRVAGAAKTAALAGGRALISGISASGRAAKAGTLAAGRATKAGALAAGRITKAGALAASETAKRLVNMEMAWAEETQRRAEEAAARAAVENAAKNKAAAAAAAKKAANAKAAAEEALKKATANKTARRAGLIWRAKARKSLATKAMNKAANQLKEQNKKAAEANKLQRAAERAANNARARALMVNLAAASMPQYTITESQKARQAANSAKRAQSAAAEKALRANEKKNLNAALKRAIANGNVEAIERMRISALFRETPAGPGQPLLKRSNKQEKVFENALGKAKKVAEAKRAGNRARQGEAKRFAEKAAANNAFRQAALRNMEEQERRLRTGAPTPPGRAVTNKGRRVQQQRQQNVVSSTGAGRVGTR